MDQTLYVIGNGFDLYHGIRSEYRYFGEYLSEVDYEVSNYLDEYLHAEESDFWSKFEANLANLDSDSLCEFASEYLIGYGAEDWSDSCHHAYQGEIKDIVDGLTIRWLSHFRRWVKGLQIPSGDDFKGRLLNIDNDAEFLSFNYTPTLQKLYGVSSENVLHIHGNSKQPDTIVLGHGWVNQETELYEYDDRDNIDPRVQQGDEIVHSYFKKTFKSTKAIIEANSSFFLKLKKIDTITVLGHSLGDVDLPYFLKIIEQNSKNRVNWTFSYYKDVMSIKAQAEKLNISKELRKYVPFDCYVLH